MIKNIREVAPLLAQKIIWIDPDLSTLKFNQNLVKANSHQLGLYYKYLGLLHDSRIIDYSIIGNKFSITLNDFTTHVFSDIIVERKNLKIDHKDLVFPIQIDFEFTNLTFNNIDEQGNIHKIEPTTIDEYLYEQIIAINKDYIEIGLVAWKANKNLKIVKPGQYILILIKAKSIVLTEHQENAWNKIFGNDYDNYFKYFRSQLDKGRFLSDQSKSYELVDEFDKKNN